MGAKPGNFDDSAQIPAGEFLVFRPLHRKEATGPHPAAISRSHTAPAEACGELSRRPAAILSRSQIFEQSLPYPSVMVRNVEKAKVWQVLSEWGLGEALRGAIIPHSFFQSNTL